MEPEFRKFEPGHTFFTEAAKPQMAAPWQEKVTVNEPVIAKPKPKSMFAPRLSEQVDDTNGPLPQFLSGFGGFGVPTASSNPVPNKTQSTTENKALPGIKLDSPYNEEILLPKLEQIESGIGKKTGEKIIGDQGRAFGPLQIHRGVVEDVNARYKTNYTHEDMHDIEKARDVFRKYIEMYVTEQRLGRPPTMEDVIRVWNGGPSGFRKIDKTQPYVDRYK